jgi:hypothetical protein
MTDKQAAKAKAAERARLKAKKAADRDRGERAKRLLEDPLFKEAFEKIDAAIVEGWRTSNGNDHEGRHNAYLMQRLLKNLKEQFAQIVRTGDAAGKELLMLEKENANAS